jgi:hypothetical protein
VLLADVVGEDFSSIASGEQIVANGVLYHLGVLAALLARQPVHSLEERAVYLGLGPFHVPNLRSSDPEAGQPTRVSKHP